MMVRKTPVGIFCDVLIYVVLGLFAFLCLYPFWYMLIYAISDPSKVGQGVYLLPNGLSLYNFEQVLKLKGIGTAFMISIFRTVFGSGLTVFSCAFLGYLFSKREMACRVFIYRALIVTMYVSGGLIPTYLLIKGYGLTDTFWVYILPSMVSAYYVILIKTFIEQLPASLEEAAMIDGAGYFTVFIKVIFPLCIPIVAAIAIFAAVGQWNSWFDNHIYISNEKLTCLQYLLYKFLNESQRIADMLKAGELNMTNAQSTVSQQLTPKAVRITVTIFASIPIFMVYPFMQRYFIKGIMIGAVKG